MSSNRRDKWLGIVTVLFHLLGNFFLFRRHDRFLFRVSTGML